MDYGSYEDENDKNRLERAVTSLVCYCYSDNKTSSGNALCSTESNSDPEESILIFEDLIMCQYVSVFHVRYIPRARSPT